MRFFSFSFQNLKGRANEDFYFASEKYPIFAVADGVSRNKNFDRNYPKISGAGLAAEEFCKKVIEYLEKKFSKSNLKTLREAFNFANKSIFRLNEKYGINKNLDYLTNDYFCTCGVAAFIKRNLLYYGYVGDCGIRVYDKNDFLRFISTNDVEPLEGWRENQKFKSKKEYWVVWRKVLRNKPKAPYLTYGVFTGEKEVKYYYHIGKIKLFPQDIVFLYSDGILPFIERSEFRKVFRKYKKEKVKKRIEKFVEKEVTLKDDKTLISILI
ncbi:protein phosphatase 2C domain-containing protein [bacterium]|nr:protein phosphatase 2C domain-containing protein [bacterium]